MSSRERILGRLREKLGRTADNAATAKAQMEGLLAARQQGPRPPVDEDRLRQFRDKSEQLSCTVDEVPQLTDAPLAVARYLSVMNLPPAAVCAPALAGLDWRSVRIDVQGRGARDGDLVGITGCFCAVAETGTLMLLSAPETPATVSLLPETHIALVPASRIVAGMEDGWQLVRQEQAQLPRAVNFISGPSRTADIEQTIVLGAHGPYRVHLVIVRGA